MAEKSFPFDAEEVEGSYDRVYLADDFAEYFRQFISSGVFMKASTNLQVLANDDMTVTLSPGGGIIEGYRYENTADITIQLAPADGVLNRIDRISFTWDKEARDIHYTLRQGVASYSPTPPECRRSADYKDFVVADIYVPAGAISVAQANITDQRLNSEVCGLAIAFSEIDTTSIFNEFQSWFEETKAAGNTEVTDLINAYASWIERLEADEMNECADLLERMRDLIDEATAAHLQNEIDGINDGKGVGTQSKVTTYSGSTVSEKWFDGSHLETVYDGNVVTEKMYDNSDTLKWTKTTTYNGNEVTETVEEA